jgi:hypothetical protein
MNQNHSKISAAFNSKTVIRLSQPDRHLILAGLTWIISNYKSLNGRMTTTSLLETTWARRFDPGVFNQELMDMIIGLRVIVMSLPPGDRLRVNTSVEIAACALAVRVAVKRHWHVRTLLVIPRVDSASRRLLRRLEAVRKRAKRAEVRQSGLNSYQARARDWQRFIRWIRVHTPDCGSIKPRSPARFGRPRLIVDKLVSWVRDELMDRKERLPNERELRRLVRLALRYTRRGRTQFGIRDLMEDKGFASVRLAAFVTVHMEKVSNRRTS